MNNQPTRESIFDPRKDAEERAQKTIDEAFENTRGYLDRAAAFQTTINNFQKIDTGMLTRADVELAYNASEELASVLGDAYDEIIQLELNRYVWKNANNEKIFMILKEETLRQRAEHHSFRYKVLPPFLKTIKILPMTAPLH